MSVYLSSMIYHDSYTVVLKIPEFPHYPDSSFLKSRKNQVHSGRLKSPQIVKYSVKPFKSIKEHSNMLNTHILYILSQNELSY